MVYLRKDAREGCSGQVRRTVQDKKHTRAVGGWKGSASQARRKRQKTEGISDRGMETRRDTPPSLRQEGRMPSDLGRDRLSVERDVLASAFFMTEESRSPVEDARSEARVESCQPHEE